VADLETYYEKMKEVYFAIYRQVGLGKITLLTYASGGAFSKYSHEFQVLADVGEDTIYLCERCLVAVNKEIIADQPTCPVCGSQHLVEKQAIEAGNIFKLGTKFSGSLGFKYADQNGEQQLVEMGCYGLGISRLMGIIAEISHDDRGLIWPQSVAPFAAHLISLPGAEIKAQHLYDQLIQAGVEVLWDDRVESAGSKFADADLIGLPVRLVVSPKTGEQVEWKNRSGANTELIAVNEAAGRLKA
jgi:prolyl-tRNA synthetase